MKNTDVVTETGGSSMTDQPVTKAKRGFAVMDPKLQRQIAAMGGKAAHELGVAHEWDGEEAAAAGSKGGITVSQDRAHMVEIGRRGGENRHKYDRTGKIDPA